MSSENAAEHLAELLAARDDTVAVVESLTGGLVVQALARLEGSGEWLMGGVVAYHRSVKHGLLEVTAQNVVSSQAAGEMAASVRRCLRADVGIAITGAGGPDPQDGQPPGTVWLGVDDGGGPVTVLAELEGDPEQICNDAVTAALRFAGDVISR